jgi:23S rRNA-/tRNA-specific pseudouridylate synthase
VAPLSLLHVTPHEIVVCKPPGLASELPRDPNADSLVTRLRTEGFADLRLVHRLDAPTSGVMIVARSAEAAAHYSTEIAERRWKKIYVAEVSRPIDQARALVGEHKAYLATKGRRALVVNAGGKPSFLSIVHASPAAERRTHLLIRLHTGRFHQIRAMLAALGAPLMGDSMYGGPDGRFYLEQVVLAAHLFGSDTISVWRAPGHAARPAWHASLAAAADAEAALAFEA